jgi:cysteinyl-tRNA synthetase
MEKKYNNVLDLIGNTPLVQIKRLNPNKKVKILAKLEYFNPGGSIKDRPALQMIEDAEKKGELTKDKIILEATSGNTGIGLAMVAAVKGYRVLLVMSESASEERKKILSAMGAELRFTPSHLGTDGAIETAYELIREHPDKYWLSDQYNNESNWLAHYNGTAIEIWEQTGGSVDAVVSAIGTTGTLMGLSRRLKELKPGINIIGIEPFLGHKIQGLKNMSESYRPGIFDKERADRIIKIDDEEAFQTTRLMARKEGIFVGMSSGAAMAGALRLAQQMTEGTIVAILPDGGERYLSTPLFEDRKKSGQFFFNTLTRKKEEFIPIDENQVKIYTCGPTLFHLIDVGQARRFIFADLLVRYMGHKGFKVTHIMNVTDLDDRTIEGSDSAGVPINDFTEGFYQEFMKDLDLLNIKRASEYPRATQNVDGMIEAAGKLIEKGYAYEKFRSIYFDISRFRDYGKLSKIDFNKIKIGKTVDLESYEKENPRDFTLLKRSTLKELKGGIFYQTKWGNVRPSWHLECPVMSMKYLGETYDIHTSGIDLIFPHHENTIAITQALTGKRTANYWLHNELVNINARKDARSEVEDYSIRRIMDKGYSGRVIRYWLISRHYRKPVSFSYKQLDMAAKTLSNFDKFITRVLYAREGGSLAEMDQLVYDLKNNFTAFMDDDLNVAAAMAALFRFSNRINAIIDSDGISTDDKVKILECLRVLDSVFGFIDFNPGTPDKKIEGLIEEREIARKAGQWDKADQIRRKLDEMGIELIDARERTIWRMKSATSV